MSDWQIVKDIILIAVAITGAGTAIFGLRTWRKQLKGKTEYDLTRRLLRAVYKVRDAIHHVRNPFMSTVEISLSLEETGIKTNHTDKDFSRKSSLAVYQTRWKKVTEALSDLDVEALEAEILWSDKIQDEIKELKNYIAELNKSIKLYFHEELAQELSEQELKKHHDTIYKKTDNVHEDPFGLKIYNIVANIEKAIKKHLKI